MKAKRFFLSSLMLITTLASAQPAGESPAYHIVVNFPESMGWRVQSDTGMTGAGSIRVYVPTENSNTQNVTVMYAPIQSSLTDSVEQVKTVMAMAGCANAATDVITQQEDMLIFTTTQSGCSDGRALEQTFKVFQKDGGQYTAVYATNPNTVSQDVRDTMKKVIESATLAAGN